MTQPQSGDGPPKPPARGGSPLTRVVLILTGMLGVAALAWLGVDEARRSGLVADGTRAPGFQLRRYDGGTLKLDELKGKVVMLDFWATWCPPCREEMPALVKLAREYEARGLVFVAASRDDSDTAPALVDAFVKRHLPELGPYVVYAPDELAVAFQVSVLPTLYFLDREGKVVDAQRGMLTEAALRRRIEKALAAPGPSAP